MFVLKNGSRGRPKGSKNKRRGRKSLRTNEETDRLNKLNKNKKETTMSIDLWGCRAFELDLQRRSKHQPLPVGHTFKKSIEYDEFECQYKSDILAHYDVS